MEITDAEFEFATEPHNPAYVMRVQILGTDLDRAGAAFVAQVGDLGVHDMISLIDRDGFQGFLTAEPPVGAELRVGYAGKELTATGITYQPPSV